MESQYLQLGVSGLVLFILFVIVKWFIATITKQSDQMFKMVSDFNTTVNNHMVHETEAFNSLSKIVNLHIAVLEKAAKVLANVNRKKRTKKPC